MVDRKQLITAYKVKASWLAFQCKRIKLSSNAIGLACATLINTCEVTNFSAQQQIQRYFYVA